MNIAIIGAGMAGLAAAQRLSDAGHQVTIFDKGRGPGGRMSTRRADTPIGECRWDHGAQYFTARTPEFRSVVEDLQKDGAVTVWRPRIVRMVHEPSGWSISPEPPKGEGQEMFVGSPAMNSVIKALAATLDVRWSQRVTAIIRSDKGNILEFESGDQAGPFDLVVSAVPAEQAADLLSGISPALASEAGQARSAPCWAVMLGFDRKVPVEWDGAKLESTALSWVARNSAKPGRSDAETWVLHASPDWSRAHSGMDKADVAALLAEQFCGMTGASAPVFKAAHRWLLAMVESPIGTPFGWDAGVGVASIGDWRIAPRIEAAWQSGHNLSKFLLR